MLWFELLKKTGFVRQVMRIGRRSVSRRYRKLIARHGKPANAFPADLDHAICIGKSHIDAAWQWQWRQTVDKCRKTFSRAVEHIEKFPDFFFSQSSPQFFYWLEEYDPELLHRIKEKVAEGRFELTGGMWVEPDGNMPSGEAFCRQRLYGMRYFKDRFDTTPVVEYLPDTFGYSSGLPQILCKSGANYFFTEKLAWNETNPFPAGIPWYGLFNRRARNRSYLTIPWMQMTTLIV